MSEKRKLTLRIRKFDFKKLSIKKPNFKKLISKKFLKTTLLVFLGLAVLGSGIIIGVYRAIMQNLPDISKLEEFEPKIITYVYSADGQVIGEYAREKRIEVKYRDIPEILIKAIIATEDPRFYKHKGIDYLGILRAVKADLKLIFTPRKLHGGSTITQQLIRELLLHRRQELRRKIKEAILARQIEKRYTKEEILEFYCNQFNLGHGAYGVEAASRLYFDKSVADLNLEESALITGIFRGPSYYSPYTNAKVTLRRRNHVLNRMVEEKFISEDEAEEAKKKPMGVMPRFWRASEFAAYFNEEVRKYLEQNYGVDALYHSGLKVYTTLDPDMQRYAEEALIKQLHVLDKQQGWRDDKKNLLEEGVENLEEVKPTTDLLSSWLKPDLPEGKIVDAVVLTVENREAAVKIKDYTGFMTHSGIEWTETKNLKNLIKRGDIIKVKINSIDEEHMEMKVSLEQEPVLEGAFLAIEPQTGQIQAMVGGYSYERLQFNQAIQALRQSGSVIKPFLYTAAIENGWTPSSAVVDEPVEFVDKWADKPYAPENYDRKYKGRVTLRKGIEESRNVVTTKILDHISPQTGVKYCQKFGLTSPIYPYLSLALGAFEVRLIEMVSGFTVFPNKGVRIKPYFITRIEDKDGNILEEQKVESIEVISPQVAYMMTSLLQGVVQRGTAQAARWLEKPLGGKTGTTDDYSNAWFVGFSPDLCAGVWIGHELGNITIGERKSGAVAALPVWVEFMQNVIEDKKRIAEENGEEYDPGEFEVPPLHTLEFKTVDLKTGLLATYICLFPFEEVYLPGTAPTRWCSYEDHLMAYDYYDWLKRKEGNNQ
ncbi:MAG: PBP1A family penicillin-binding protein [Candidatus Aminicenantes bacterium]|jgi:penicillin-binding protein 1A